MIAHVLTLVVFLPLVGVAVILAGGSRLADASVRVIALVVTLLTFVVSLTILGDFDRSTASFQLVEEAAWSESAGLSYIVGVDGISLWLVLLDDVPVPDHRARVLEHRTRCPPVHGRHAGVGDGGARIVHGP